LIFFPVFELTKFLRRGFSIGFDDSWWFGLLSLLFAADRHIRLKGPPSSRRSKPEASQSSPAPRVHASQQPKAGRPWPFATLGLSNDAVGGIAQGAQRLTFTFGERGWLVE
jgi:hypothetical protein